MYYPLSEAINKMYSRNSTNGKLSFFPWAKGNIPHPELNNPESRGIVFKITILLF
jgi:hypothetical protein